MRLYNQKIDAWNYITYKNNADDDNTSDVTVSTGDIIIPSNITNEFVNKIKNKWTRILSASDNRRKYFVDEKYKSRLKITLGNKSKEYIIETKELMFRVKENTGIGGGGRIVNTPYAEVTTKRK